MFNPNEWQRAKLVGIEALTPTTRAYRVQPDVWVPQLAGQHIDIRLTAPDGYQAARAYSIASDASVEGEYELAIEVLPDGEVSGFFHEAAEVGTEFEIRGPLGGFFHWTPEVQGDIVLVGGGSGVTPLIAMARAHLATNHDARFVMLHSSRSWDDVVFREALLQLEKDSPNFEYRMALTRDQARRPQDISERYNCENMRKILDDTIADPALVYVCGSNPFVEGTAGCFIDYGMTADKVKVERFGG